MLWPIALGGAVGSVLRYLVGGWLQPARSAFPWGTLALLQRGDWARALVYVGVSVLASLGAVAVGVAIVPR